MVKTNDLFDGVPNLPALIEQANHVDVKTVESEVSLRKFLAGMFAYYPRWMKALYAIRWGFVRLLGMKQEGIPDMVRVAPDDVPLTAGDKMAFFDVEMAAEEAYWFASAAESHLTAHLGVVVEPLDGQNGRRRFHVLTIVHYNSWAGPVYFNVIRPFHHLVVRQMALAGARGSFFQ